MSKEYIIKIENFEGPLDLLFHLIEKNKIDIYDIPIATVTEQYMDYLKAMEEMDLEITSEFLVMASTLLHIKSKMLLPDVKTSDEEEEQEDPREELVARLLEYKKYKEFAQHLKQREEQQQYVYYKVPDLIEEEEVNSQLIGLSADDLVNAFKKIIERNNNKIDDKPFPKVIHQEKVSVAKKVRQIVRTFKNKEIIKFVDLFENTNRMDKLATFLAILELIKLKRVFIEQSVNFGDIIIYKNKNYKSKK